MTNKRTKYNKMLSASRKVYLLKHLRDMIFPSILLCLSLVSFISLNKFYSSNSQDLVGTACGLGLIWILGVSFLDLRTHFCMLFKEESSHD